MRFLSEIASYNSDAELWWDSSPAVFDSWTKAIRLSSKDISELFNSREPLGSLFRGATTNPRLIADCITEQPAHWQTEVHRLIDETPYDSLQSIYWRLYKAVLRDAAARLRYLWESTDGKYGWVCAQVDPRDCLDGHRMYQQGLELAALGPNVMVKIPGSAAGYETVEQLVASGISINSTFSYTVPQVRCCLRAIEAGLQRRKSAPVRWRSVITFMIGRFGSQGDLLDQARARGIDLRLADVRWAEVAIFRKMLSEITNSGIPAKLLLSSIKADPGLTGDSVSCWHLEKTAGTPIAYTLTPTLLKSLIDANYTLPDVAKRGSMQELETIPAALHARLMSLPYFASASTAEGMPAESFHHQGAFITTAAEACASVRRMHDFIAQGFQARHCHHPKPSLPPLARVPSPLAV
ncbi:hypothetical protein LJ656_24580 [Paraburkholderia sp. MMS20-SJTR3]|uniref:Transaldolase n=1 Tax=Paraburkholderia sejongensis TaxID=2886946 RepID=A0ABS8K0T3_9BURK|nr:transaldolase family protein [Paraburkholderia sp. MMS20-SJTR3]MCC8395765.1 hypothetical protein [Paraburkholderia sp. MMS20-SJTR3]